MGNTVQPLLEGRKVPWQPPDPVRAVTHQSRMDRAGASRRTIDTRIFSTRERPRWPHHAEGLEGLFREPAEPSSPAEPIPNRTVHRSPQPPNTAISAFGQKRTSSGKEKPGTRPGLSTLTNEVHSVQLAPPGEAESQEAEAKESESARLGC